MGTHTENRKVNSWKQWNKWKHTKADMGIQNITAREHSEQGALSSHQINPTEQSLPLMMVVWSHQDTLLLKNQLQNEKM
jgi:hypothetical protein